MYSRISIIGLGTIGGFLARHISEISWVEEIIVVDYDQVVAKNIQCSIYRNQDVGKYKTDAIEEIISSINDKVKITKINQKFVEGECELPDSDLVIDCRDFTYDRKDLIDIRLFISSRSLFIDCRKNVSYQYHKEGRYNTELTKLDFISAAAIATKLIQNGSIDELIKRADLIEVDLDHFDQQIFKSRQDVLYELDASKHLLNVPESVVQILELNKRQDLTLCVNDIQTSPVKKTFPRNSLKTYFDVVQNLSGSIPKTYSQNSYIISVKSIQNNTYIVLIPESGAA